MDETLLSASRLLGADGTADGEEHFGVHITYNDLYHSIVFLTAIYAAGFAVSRFLSMPALVGEIFMGILLGPNLLDFVPNGEAFVMLGEIGLFLLVLEAGIDIDLTTLKLIGARGIIIALVGTFLPVLIAFGIARLLGYQGIAAVAGGCVFAPTSLGIAMNVLRQSNIANTPVGQLIVAAAIIDDMVALVILSQLRAFAQDGEVSALDMLIPVFSALGFLLVGGALAVGVLPKAMDKLILNRIPQDSRCSREWVSLAIMFSLLLALIPATYYAKASPLMGAFLAGLVFCSYGNVHHMFVTQFKRVMQWLMRIFFAASIGFQVPIQMFGSGVVVGQGLLFTLALLGKVATGFLVPNFGSTKGFRSIHLRDCLVVGFSMMAEGEFAFVIAVFSVVHNMIPQEMYAAVVLAVLISTVIAPLALRTTIGHFNKKMAATVYGDGNEDPDALLEKGVREQTAVFFCIQTKSTPSWGLQTDIMRALDDLNLDVIDHRSWHPRVDKQLLVNEVYVKDSNELYESQDSFDIAKQAVSRTSEIEGKLHQVICQVDAVVRVQRWFPEIPDDASIGSNSDHGVSEMIVRATGAALEESRRRSGGSDDSPRSPMEDGAYVSMEEQDVKQKKQPEFHRQISHLDSASKGHLEGLFRRDKRRRRRRRDVFALAIASEEGGIELLDNHGVGTGYLEAQEKYDVHGTSMS